MPRNRYRQCPACNTASLDSSSHPSIFDCRLCHGLWFEDGALNQAIAEHHDGVDQYDH